MQPTRATSLALAAVVLTGGAVAAAVGRPHPAVRDLATVRAGSPARTISVAAAAGAPRLTAWSPAAQRAVAALRQQVASALAGSTAARRAVHVYLTGLGDVDDVNGAAGMPPASTEKLFFGLSDLLRDPNRRLVTAVRTVSAPVLRTVTGALYLVGAGDPSLTSADLAALAAAVRANGVRVVQGGLRVDVSSLSNVRRLPGWKPDYVPDELGPLSGLVVDRNAYRSDPGYLLDPVPANLAKFRLALAHVGVRVFGTSWYGYATAAKVTIASHASAPVSSLVAHTLKQSDNFYAEQLLADLGTAMGVGSATTGLGVIHRYGQILRVTTGPMVDASGLSTLDSQTAAGQVRWLVAGGATAVATMFRLSLPAACRDGTLRMRLCGTAAAGRVWAKTGTLDGVRALAGYAHTRSGRWAAFSVLFAGARNGDAARAAADRVALAVQAFAA